MEANATGKAFVAFTTAHPVRRRANVSPRIASMDIAAETFVQALARRVPMRRKAADTMEYAAMSPMERIRKTNAIQANVMVPALVISPKPNNRTALFARKPRNARLVSAWMAFVVMARARSRVKLVPLPKKAKASMARVAASLREPILTTNA
jgi:hypothetical protein